MVAEVRSWLNAREDHLPTRRACCWRNDHGVAIRAGISPGTALDQAHREVIHVGTSRAEGTDFIPLVDEPVGIVAMYALARRSPVGATMHGDPKPEPNREARHKTEPPCRYEALPEPVAGEDPDRSETRDDEGLEVLGRTARESVPEPAHRNVPPMISFSTTGTNGGTCSPAARAPVRNMSTTTSRSSFRCFSTATGFPTIPRT